MLNRITPVKILLTITRMRKLKNVDISLLLVGL